MCALMHKISSSLSAYSLPDVLTHMQWWMECMWRRNPLLIWRNPLLIWRNPLLYDIILHLFSYVHWKVFYRSNKVAIQQTFTTLALRAIAKRSHARCRLYSACDWDHIFNPTAVTFTSTAWPLKIGRVEAPHDTIHVIDNFQIATAFSAPIIAAFPLNCCSDYS